MDYKSLNVFVIILNIKLIFHLKNGNMFTLQKYDLSRFNVSVVIEQ